MSFSSATAGTVTIFTVFRVPPLSGLAPETTVWMEERCCACTGCFSVYGRLRLFKITAFMHSEGSLLVTVTIISCSVFTNRSQTAILSLLCLLSQSVTLRYIAHLLKSEYMHKPQLAYITTH